MAETFILQMDNELYIPQMYCNQRGFTHEELMDFVNRKGITEYTIISVEEEIKKYELQGDLCHKELMSTETYNFDTWRNAFQDNNINGFSLPRQVANNEEYVDDLKAVFEQYCTAVSKPAFIYEKGLISDIQQNCNEIIGILQRLIEKDTDSAEKHLKQLIEKFMNDKFLVSELDKSYSFRGIAPFFDLQIAGYRDLYERMNSKELSFFRARTRTKGDTKDISKIQHILHLPYEKKEFASNMRFSCSGVPCLYLGTTSYVCSKECNWNPKQEELFVSAFVPNEQGSKLKILNLTISQALINGIYNKSCDVGGVDPRRTLQLSMLRIFPLVIATSYRILEVDRPLRYEYLISQALMKAINKMDIDGVAYLSMRGKNEFQYPHGVNLALPAFDISKDQPYSKYCEMFDVTSPILFAPQAAQGVKSYINAIYTKTDVNGQESYLSKIDVNGRDIFYGDTEFANFDDFLVSENTHL